MLILASVYIPQSGRPEEERREIFDLLAGSSDRLKHQGVVAWLGDFNARVGPPREGEHQVFGRHAFGPMSTEQGGHGHPQPGVTAGPLFKRRTQIGRLFL
eukprot:13232469-Alexandrium_andersonii.AAC.1